MPSGSTVDYSHIYEVCGNNEGFILNLLEVITKGLKEYPLKLQGARQQNNWPEVREVAHKYKSSVAYLYHQRLDEILDKLETSAEKELPIAALKAAIDQALALSAEVKEDVDQKVQELKA